jgi:hypothetical protein
MNGNRGATADSTEALDETVRQALELVTEELLTTSKSTADGLKSAFDAALLCTFERLVAESAAARGHARPPFATGPELQDERTHRDSLSMAANERLDELLGVLEYDALSFQQVGGVYERSLDYEPEMEDDGVRLTDDATRRASVGAYYTPNEVVGYAVSRALDGTEGTEEETRVLDPAMGSGNFLTCAIERLAEARDEPTEQARRYVAENLVFGVDVDPLAVELARSAVWFETGVWPDDTLVVGDALAGDPEWLNTDGFDGGRFDAVVAPSAARSTSTYRSSSAWRTSAVGCPVSSRTSGRRRGTAAPSVTISSTGIGWWNCSTCPPPRCSPTPASIRWS